MDASCLQQSLFLPLPCAPKVWYHCCLSLLCFPDKLTSASKESLNTHTSPSQSPNSVHSSRRGSISSMSSVSSVLDEKDDDRIRCCTHCKDTLLKREQQIDEKEHTPDIVKLYEVICVPQGFWLTCRQGAVCQPPCACGLSMLHEVVIFFVHF